MKIYQQPVTEIELAFNGYCPILASLVGETKGGRIGLPIFGDVLVDPGFNSNTTFSKHSVWKEEDDAEEGIALFD